MEDNSKGMNSSVLLVLGQEDSIGTFKRKGLQYKRKQSVCVCGHDFLFFLFLLNVSLDPRVETLLIKTSLIPPSSK